MEVEQLCYDDGAARVFTINSHENLRSETLSFEEVDAAILDARIGEEWNRDLGLHLMRKEIPFVFATGYAGSEPFFTAFPEIPIVGKPFVGRELVQALSAAIERTRSGDR
ncbi:response regulator [Chelativorans sp. M5D2P16]|uniref:response regulator n=1 Tax=Chelativorans sp. M5D2P16 TaxID=3095678 RepID=UPI002ACA092E|nr:response regulator [Chelativorans sp. M5D2P16]MDZ5699142.1 response regulator [Chelativorans sp. M5D2P16]